MLRKKEKMTQVPKTTVILSALLVLILSLLISSPRSLVEAQSNVTISGRITGPTGDPVVGLEVGAASAFGEDYDTTDSSGNYSLTLSADNFIHLFIYPALDSGLAHINVGFDDPAPTINTLPLKVTFNPSSFWQEVNKEGAKPIPIPIKALSFKNSSLFIIASFQ